MKYFSNLRFITANIYLIGGMSPLVCVQAIEPKRKQQIGHEAVLRPKLLHKQKLHFYAI